MHSYPPKIRKGNAEKHITSENRNHSALRIQAASEYVKIHLKIGGARHKMDNVVRVLLVSDD